MQKQIPERCHTCPAYIINAEEIAEISEDVDRMTSMALSDGLDKASQIARDLLIGTGEATPEEVSAEKMAHTVRKDIGGAVEALNARITGIQAGMAALAIDCNGPVVITGEANRHMYEATICASESNPSEQIQPVVVNSWDA